MWIQTYTVTQPPRLAAVICFLHINSLPCCFPWGLACLVGSYEHRSAVYLRTFSMHKHIIKAPQVGLTPLVSPGKCGWLCNDGWYYRVDIFSVVCVCVCVYLIASLCNHCPSTHNFSHGNDPSIILLPWQHIVNPVWPSAVIHCVSIHLHSSLPLSLVSLVLSMLQTSYIYLFNFCSIAHILFSFFLSPTCVGVFIASVTQVVNTATQDDVILQRDRLFMCTHVLYPCSSLWLSALSYGRHVAACCRTAGADQTKLTYSQRNYCFRSAWGAGGVEASTEILIQWCWAFEGLCVLCVSVAVYLCVKVHTQWISNRLSCHCRRNADILIRLAALFTQSHRLLRACQIFSLSSNNVAQSVQVPHFLPLYWFSIEFSSVNWPWRFEFNFLLLLLLCDTILKLPWQLFASPKCECVFFFLPMLWHQTLCSNEEADDKMGYLEDSFILYHSGLLQTHRSTACLPVCECVCFSAVSDGCSFVN